MSTRFLGKKVILIAILAVGAIAAIFVASSTLLATAQVQQRMLWSDQGLPQINGSVNVANEVASFLNENAKVSFVQAAEAAQGQEDDGKVIGGHIGVVQGYLVYTFFVANTGNQTGQLVVVDAGNGDVLYASEAQPFGSFGPMAGHWGGHGFGGWHAWDKSRGWGPWH
jgi:uncharacterized membrane protein YkoI